MAVSVTRLANAIETIRDAIATASDLPPGGFGNDDDLVDDLGLDELELESLGLIIEEIFAIQVPDELWTSPLFRTPQSLAEWCIRQSQLAAEYELQRQRKRA